MDNNKTYHPTEQIPRWLYDTLCRGGVINVSGTIRAELVTPGTVALWSTAGHKITPRDLR